jgi:murein DD-endopeptidase MepM/ murein hydrolase activator NlpD
MSHHDRLDPAPWVPRSPRIADRVRAGDSDPPLRSTVRRVALSAALGLCVTSIATAVAGLPVAPIGSDGRNAAALGLGSAAPADEVKEEEPSSLAITSNSGPYHPVRMDEPMDYGAYDAKFGADRGGRRHEGQDVMADSGTPLVAVRDARVIEKGNDGGRGNYVALYSPAEDQTYVYFHMLRPSGLKVGAEVPAGTQVGAMGCTGSCYGTHLHFEVRLGEGIDRKPIDPLPMLQQWPVAPE